jgi:hypothetical protein
VWILLAMSAALSRFWSLWRRRRCSRYLLSDGLLCNYCNWFSIALKFALKRQSLCDWLTTFCPHPSWLIASYRLEADVYVSSCGSYYQLYLL